MGRRPIDYTDRFLLLSWPMKLCQILAPVKSSEIPFQLEDEVSGSLKQPALIAGNAKTLLKEHCSERPRKVPFARKWS